MGDGPQRLEYERAEVRPPVGRVAMAAVAVSAAFVVAALWVWVLGTRYRLAPAVDGLWVVIGMVAGALVLRVRARVRQGPVREARAGWWALVLLMLGLVLGGLGVARKMVVRRHQHGETSDLVQCASNMKQIGTAILLYSNDNHGRYPGRLEELLLTRDIDAYAFVCPMTDDEAAAGPTTRAVADALTAGGHLSYVYVGAELTNQSDPDTVVLYESPSNHQGNGMNVLFGDGHVEFLKPAEAREIIDRVAVGERPVVWKGPGVRSGPTTRGG